MEFVSLGDGAKWYIPLQLVMYLWTLQARFLHTVSRLYEVVHVIFTPSTVRIVKTEIEYMHL